MEDFVEIKSRLQMGLSALPSRVAVDEAALDDLLSKLAEPRRIYQLLSSRLTVRQVLWCLVDLLAHGQLRQVIVANQYRWVRAGESEQRLPGQGLHLVGDDCLQLNPRFRDILADLLNDKKSQYSQSVETYETLIRRYKIMQSLGDLNHANLLLLGDDALFSLFLAVHGYRQSIVVADIDPHLLATIDRVAGEQGFSNIEVVEYDVFQPLPPALVGRFDCFAVNGFKDQGGLLMFICRALQSLKAPAAMRSGFVNFGSHEVQCAHQLNLEAQMHATLARFGVYMDYTVPCPETHVCEAFEDAFGASIPALARLSAEQRQQACDEALGVLRQRFADLSWVEMDNFPDIQLSPLKMGRCRVVQRHDREVSRFLRLGQLYAHNTQAVAVP
ncbi:bis-aminopropyl spermidine synthase family protein [Pseudomonas orientalis]|uniref:bis-aminopropyl spermidine synthase family protein n=1 Tax=Pseudomonas orientalis TaxID=76758 RepID=UPI0030D90B49